MCIIRHNGQNFCFTIVVSLWISNPFLREKSMWNTSRKAPKCVSKQIHMRIAKQILLNTLRTRQNGRHFPDDIFKWIFLNENEWISINISLKFVPKAEIDNIPALVQIMAWRRPGYKPLSEPMMVSLLTHICVTRPQWVNMLTYIIIHCIRISRQQWHRMRWSERISSWHLTTLNEAFCQTACSRCRYFLHKCHTRNAQTPQNTN